MPLTQTSMSDERAAKLRTFIHAKIVFDNTLTPKSVTIRVFELGLLFHWLPYPSYLY